MQSIENITAVLSGLLSPDTSTRTLAENYFLQLKSENLSQLLHILTEILLSLKEISYKQLVLILLRQIFSNPSTPNIWQILSLSDHEKITQNLLNYSHSELNFSVLSHLSSVLTTYNSSLYTLNHIISQEILELALDNLETASPLAYLSFSIIIEYFVHYYDYFQYPELLFSAFQKQLQSEFSEIRIICIKAFCMLILILDTPEVMYFGQLLPDLFKALLKIQGNDEVFICLRDAGEAEPLFFIKRIEICLKFSEIVLYSTNSPSCKYFCCDFLSKLCLNPENIHISTVTLVLSTIKNYISQMSSALLDEINYVDLCAEAVSLILENNRGLLKEFLVNACGNLIFPNKYLSELIQIEKLIRFLGPEVILIIELLKVSGNIQEDMITLKAIQTMWRYSELASIDIGKVLGINLEGMSHFNEFVRESACEALEMFIDRGDKMIVGIYSTHLVSCIGKSKDFLKKRIEVMKKLVRVVGKFRKGVDSEEIFRFLQGCLDGECCVEALECILLMNSYFPMREKVLNVVSGFSKLAPDVFLQSLPCLELITKHLPEESLDLFPGLLGQLIEHVKFPSNHLESYLQTLIITVQNLGIFASPYLLQCQDLTITLFSSNNLEILTQTSLFAGILIKTLKKCKISNTTTLARTYIQQIWTLFESNSFQIDLISALISIMKQFNFPCCSNEDAETISNKISFYLAVQLNSDLLFEECRLSAYFIRNHPEFTIKLQEKIEEVLIGQILKNAEEREICQVLQVLTEIVVIAGWGLEGKIWKFLEVFLKFAQVCNGKVRCCAVRAVGVISQFFTVEMFGNVAQEAMAALESCLRKGKKNDKYLVKAGNQAVLTVGVILQRFLECFVLENVIAWWVSFLPVNDRKIDAKVLQILMDLVQREALTLDNLDEKTFNKITELLKPFSKPE